MKNISVYSICVTFYSFAKEKKRRFYDDFQIKIENQSVLVIYVLKIIFNEIAIVVKSDMTCDCHNY